MATATVMQMAFDTWWEERVVEEHGASVPFLDLWRDHKRHMKDRFVGRQSFVRFLNLRKVRETKRQGLTWRLHVRLAEEGEMSSAEARRWNVAPSIAGQGTKAHAPAYVPLRVGVEAPLGPIELRLTCAGDDDLASARVAADVFQARCRQRKPKDEGGEGFSNADDDKYGGQLALASAAYAFAAGQPEDYRAFLAMNGKPARTGSEFGWHVLDIVRRLWPWDPAWWKPKTPREDLVRAGALIIAAIEKIDRAEARQHAEAEEARLSTGV